MAETDERYESITVEGATTAAVVQAIIQPFASLSCPIEAKSQITPDLRQRR